MEKRSLLYVGNKLSTKGVTASTIDSLSTLLEEEDYKVYTASSFKNKLLRFLDMLWAVLRYSKKVSVVLIDTYSTQNFYYAVAVAKLCRMLGLDYIPILHGGNLPDRLKKSPVLSRKLFKNAKSNVSPSMYLIEAFKSHGFDNLTHIPNSIELENYPFLLRKELQPKLLWVRSFTEIYNPLLALDVVELLQKKGIDVSLTMVGPEKDGSLEKCEKEVEKRNLPVTFTGKLKKSEWLLLSEDHDIFINTTNFDNTPVSVIEAMALGLPVISTNVGGIPHLISDKQTGILVPPNDSAAIEKAINQLLNEPDLGLTISKNARKSIETFDWQKVKVRWHVLLNE
ncbi:glycosyltransferase family 4 protein [Ulvibacter antarcticus]|uniref:Glycosyltransferase involved in cell wall biosynthesis n=1 Tax=Ulvibacter antarcticus TaxID=442714 RepID=A0A3L9YC97_9FLAO|nr:glycosyltransferase family 4 protein [Ulvibacter antarcticus]RMA57994.1 glycosyltransferase involved in cell wall biosynthesis [Ulvibacter antarcticus]